MPAAFFEPVLGPHLKYLALLAEGVDALGAAEAAMLALSAERARLADGQDILDLGCGWGSLTLWARRALSQLAIAASQLARPARVHRGARRRRT